MENYPSNNHNHSHLLILDPMPLRVCPPSSESSDQSSSSSSTQNVESSFSSVTPLCNSRMYDPKMNRLTAVKRLVRNRGKAYPKYGPYPCQWCPAVLLTSQSFAGHMRGHYRKIGTAARKAAKQAQRQQQQQQRQQKRKQQLLTPEQQQAKALFIAQERAREQLVKARVRTEKLEQLLAQMNGKAKTQARPKPRAPAIAPEPAPTPTPTPTPTSTPTSTPTPVASGSARTSGKQPLRTNDVHLRLANCEFGLIIAPGNKDTSVSTDSVSNARDFILYSRGRPSIDVNKKPIVKQEVFTDEDVTKPPPGFHHLLPWRQVEFDDDDDMVACGSALKL